MDPKKVVCRVYVASSSEPREWDDATHRQRAECERDDSSANDLRNLKIKTVLKIKISSATTCARPLPTALRHHRSAETNVRRYPSSSRWKNDRVGPARPSAANLVHHGRTD